MQVVSKKCIEGNNVLSTPNESTGSLSLSSVTSTSSHSPVVVRPPKRAPAKDPPFRLDGKIKEHMLEKFPGMKSDSTLTRRCHVCSKNNKNSETRWFCKICGVPLHPGKCDTGYHTLKTY